MSSTDAGRAALDEGHNIQASQQNNNTQTSRVDGVSQQCRNDLKAARRLLAIRRHISAGVRDIPAGSGEGIAVT